MRRTTTGERVFVCHECHVAGAAVDDDACCTGCGTDLDAYEENAYFVGPGFDSAIKRAAADSDARQREEIRRLRALARLVVTQTDQDENGDMPDSPRGALLTLRDAAASALKPTKVMR